MPTRVLVAYLLIFLLAAGVTGVVWRSVYYSERNVRRRARHARRERHRAEQEGQQGDAGDDDASARSGVNPAP